MDFLLSWWKKRDPRRRLVAVPEVQAEAPFDAAASRDDAEAAGAIRVAEPVGPSGAGFDRDPEALLAAERPSSVIDAYADVRDLLGTQCEGHVLAGARVPQCAPALGGCIG